MARSRKDGQRKKAADGADEPVAQRNDQPAIDDISYPPDRTEEGRLAADTRLSGLGDRAPEVSEGDSAASGAADVGGSDLPTPPEVNGARIQLRRSGPVGVRIGEAVASETADDAGRRTRIDAENELLHPAERFEARKRGREFSRKRKLAYLLSQEVRRIVEDLDLRQPLMMEIWSKMRIRQPLINLLRSRYDELKPADLLLLPVECLEHLDRFYRKLDEFRLYLQTTEDMPTTLETAFQRYRVAVSQMSRPLLWYLDSTHQYEEALPPGMPRAGEIIDGDT